MNSEEQLLVKKAQTGDREALGLLWDRLTPKLFGYLVNITRDKTTAEDILQNTWFKAIEALPRFVLRDVSISAWLFAIAKNECRQYWRKAKPEVPFDATEHQIASNDGRKLESQMMVEQMLNSLTEADRELLRLRYIADLPPADIAKILNINFVTARVRLHRAIARARNILNSH